MADLSPKRVVRVPSCPACGQDHGELVFHAEPVVRWWTLCPVEANPLVVAADREGVERIVAHGASRKELS